MELKNSLDEDLGFAATEALNDLEEGIDIGKKNHSCYTQF